ncbi:uncharacterized protein LOC105230801 isoform X3 [Bactrocera dorsalis]|uniref:Uncharacterized protein LOC105230801 isoform X3 n=1 Tax=Bactrocera dorsalis TaxID=27457 RepID=A0A8N4QDV9_BACDO|nr:uncharacterized protein LOC105230801 isoform X3 [Bactrocera dorsalis]
MNNLTKTELLPKSGHVNEVCKEWLVREDSALAYKLQSQEINDFYKGNRQRNAVVREDFPTALNEQIKEKEEAEKQVEMYRRRLLEQEAHDKRVAKDIADKLERDLQEQRQRELLESEEMAQQMQELYVNLPPPTRGKAQLPPPRPAKASILQQNPNEPSTSNGRYFGGSSSSQHTSSHQQLSQSPQTPQQSAFQPYHKPQQQQQHELPQTSPESYLLQQNHFSQTDCYVGISIQKSPSLTAAAASTSAVDSPSPPTSSTRKTAKSQANGSSHLLQQHQHSLSSISTGSTSSGGAAASATIMAASPTASKLSPEKYDQLVGNDGGGRGVPNAVAAERHMQAHADDIELYVDPCDYASLKEIGLPMEEIKEMSKKLKQEQKDELLARRLQQMEAHDGLTQEERDRLLAIEAQDKELAKMLQDRERAKAKRAKEKARLRKHQQKDGNTTLCSSNGSSSNGLHCGPLLPLPQDCLSFGKHSSHAAHSPTAAAANNFAYAPQPAARNGLHMQAEEQEEADIIDVEAYSNPIDVLHNQQQRQQQNGTLTNGSLSREGGRRSNGSQHNGIGAHPNSMLLNRGEDDIYTLPVDSCRPGQRPTSLNISATSDAHLLQHNSMTRSENYSIDSHDSLSRHELAPRMNYSQSSTFGIYIKALAPHRLICRFRVPDAQIQATNGKRSRRISVRISEAATN